MTGRTELPPAAPVAQSGVTPGCAPCSPCARTCEPAIARPLVSPAGEPAGESEAKAVESAPPPVCPDDPVPGMVAGARSTTAQTLRELNQTGLTLVVVEHDMAFVRDIAQRVTVLHQGRVFADGGLDEVTRRQDVRDIYLGRR